MLKSTLNIAEKLQSQNDFLELKIITLHKTEIKESHNFKEKILNQTLIKKIDKILKGPKDIKENFIEKKEKQK